MKYNGEEINQQELDDFLTRAIEYKKKKQEWEREDEFGLYVNTPDYHQQRIRILEARLDNFSQFLTYDDHLRKQRNESDNNL